MTTSLFAAISNVLPKPIIALDADGVLLDYRLSFGSIYNHHFKVELEVKDPNAFHADQFWGVETPERDALFWKDFITQDAWGKMEALPGAVEACHKLVELGFELVCVTSMPFEYQDRRLHNLQELGFPIERVIAVGKNSKNLDVANHPIEAKAEQAGEKHPNRPFKDPLFNPKKVAIDDLKPEWFVDDEFRKLQGIEGVGLVLLDPGYSDTPNVNVSPNHVSVQVENLLEFSTWLERKMSSAPTHHFFRL